MQMMFRDARVGMIGGGTSEIQRNVIARCMGLDGPGTKHMIPLSSSGLSRGPSHQPAPEQVDGWMVGTLATSPSPSKPDHDSGGVPIKIRKP